jgi:glycosyltransferase involved in cell wall biosynthesis
VSKLVQQKGLKNNMKQSGLPASEIRQEKIYLSVVIPVYQAEGCLQELYRRLVKSLNALEVTFEIIMVEDCGGDNSWSVIQELASRDDRLRGFKLSRNFGQQNAITAGLDQVRGDWTVIMDCDLQDRPEDIERLLEKVREGFDVVIARNIIRRHSWLKQVSARAFYFVFSWFVGYAYEDGVRSFRIMSRDVTNALRAMPEQMRSIGPLGIWIGFTSTYVEIELERRYAGRSSYSMGRLLNLALRNIVAFSDKPLRISISVGFTMAGCAFLYGFYTVINAMLHDIPVPGWTSLITSLYFIGGLILVNLGVVGVYIGKTFEETKRRPIYLIARRTSSNETDTALSFLPSQREPL